MATFTWKPQTAIRKLKPKVRVASFGDGYDQRVGDGINNNPASWSLTFQHTKAYMDPIIDFMDIHGGSMVFDWTPPIGGAGRFVCKEWETEVVTHDVYRLTCTFDQEFGA